MKILRVVSDLYPTSVGGLGIHVHEMSKLQAQMGHTVTVYTKNNGKEKSLEQTEGYSIVRFTPLFQFKGNPISIRLFFDLRKLIRSYDLVHAHSHLFFSTNVCALLKRLDPSIPLVITDHGLTSQTAPLWMQKIYIPTIGKWTMNSADRLLCYTMTEKEELERIGITPSKIRVIHNGIDTKLFVPHPSRESKLLIWVGRFTPGKGVEYLIKAFSSVIKTHPDARLLLVGSGPSLSSIEELITAFHLTEHIVIRERVSNEEMSTIYPMASIFILPSLTEGVPRTLLEALACEVPVICSDLPQLHSLLAGCGVIVPQQDPLALADAIRSLLEDTDALERMGREGRKKIVANYSWQDTVFQTTKVYEELLDQS